MTPVRAQFFRELTLRGRSERMLHLDVARVAALSKSYQRSPDQDRDEKIRVWLAYVHASHPSTPAGCGSARVRSPAFRPLRRPQSRPRLRQMRVEWEEILPRGPVERPLASDSARFGHRVFFPTDGRG